MMEHLFRTPDGKTIAANQLSIGSIILDPQSNKIAVTWCAIHPKQSRQVVDLHTRSSMLTVTASHRIELASGEIKEAHELKKDDELLLGNSTCFPRTEKLQKMTKRKVSIPAVELQFQDDATVAGYTHALLTKGVDPSAPIHSNVQAKCKEQSADDDQMSVDRMVPGACKSPSDESYDGVDARSMPDTDDGFDDRGKRLECLS